MKKTNLMRLREIVRTKQAQKKGKYLIDMQTANAILSIHKGLSQKNKANYTKIINADLRRASKIAWQIVGKMKGRK